MSQPSVTVLMDWCSQCLENGRGITDWERNFLENVYDHLVHGGTLSVKRFDTLERIYTQKVP